MKMDRLKGRKKITEKSGEHKHWYNEAKSQTRDTLPVFIDHLLDDYVHDYGTICHAVAAAAVGAAWAVEHDEQGGITGFQAGAIMWQFVREWLHKEGPLRMLHYRDMLYPQHWDRYCTINKDVWDYLQKQALILLKKHPKAHEDVVAHWQGIVAGFIPFGYRFEGTPSPTECIATIWARRP